MRNVLARTLASSAALAVVLATLAPVTAQAQTLRYFDPVQRQLVTIQPHQSHQRGPAPEYRRHIVAYDGPEAPGTIIIDSQSKFLYYTLPNGEAIRYGVGVGREGFGWTGEVHVGAKADWPTWTPPKEMIEREPRLVEYSSGMPGGPDNPLGARALYLYDGNKDTMYRIHGTNEPWTIGHNVSSGCIRMMNHDVIELHYLAKVGTKVIVR
ncbi:MULTISPECIES: L,D-transpeptidase [Afifella]|uniref:L,D-transpeptidase n=1 Tax=Afifella TaxID=643217 RepID=UPI000FE3740C|nr:MULTISPECIES: L,D-transpeptidase [Afifella]MCT8267085.1 L,D-transpeptidase [Afifella sp. JA880]